MEILGKVRKKKKSIQAFTLLLLLFISSTSCEKDATVKLPAVRSKLVVVSFISPQDTIIRVDITLSQPLYNNAEENKYQPVENALVTISSGLGSGTLIYDPLEKLYKLDSSFIKIREGKNYTINVSTPDGKTANATTSIPLPTVLNLEAGADSSLKVSWTDPPETEDFYRIFWQNSSYFLFEGYNQGGNFSDTIISRYVVTEWFPDTDAKNGGFSYATRYYKNNFDNSDTYIFLLHVSHEYYMYHKRLELAYNTGDNPFSEPVPMYSNVTDGFGIFAGYNMMRKKAP